MMMPIDSSFSITFLQASLSSLALALLLWLCLPRLTKRWPALIAQRGSWLLAQGVIAAAFFLPYLPHHAQLSVLPTIAVPLDPSILVEHAGNTHATPAIADNAQPSAHGNRFAQLAWLDYLAQAWLMVYALGLAYTLLRQHKGQAQWRGLLASAQVLSAEQIQAHPGFAEQSVDKLRAARLQILQTDTAISPMLFGLLRPRLLLPQHLRNFPAEQQQLIIAHELTHWQRHDLWYLHASRWLQTLFWFNPVLRRLALRLNWAQELRCDQAVLAHRPALQRKQYAAALLAQLRLQHQLLQPHASLAFGDVETSKLRLQWIRDSHLCQLTSWRQRGQQAALPVLLVALLAGSAMLQPAFAVHSSSVPDAVQRDAKDGLTNSSSQPHWHLPLAKPRVSSFYGVLRAGLTTGAHRGIDFAAKIGTPVLAIASGRVILSSDQYTGGAQYGKVVIVQHDDGLLSLYAHLSSRAVQAGDLVSAGQMIARTGASGKVSGPHLHLEVLRNADPIDPQNLLGDLSAHANINALQAQRTRLQP